MSFRALPSYAGIMSLALLVSACGGGGGGGSPPPPPPQNQTIAFATTGPVNGAVGTTVTNVASGGAGTGAITYASSDTAVAAVNATSGVATLQSPGTTTITATKAASTGFNSATATYQLIVSAATQIIAFGQTGPLTGAVGGTITNTAGGGAGTGAITYASSSLSVATVDPNNGVATLVGVGTTTITATKAASPGFSSATASYVLNVTSATQTITFVDPGPITGAVGTTVQNAATGGAGSGAITYTSDAPGVAAVNLTTGVATLVGAGSATITAIKAASPGFNSATATYELQVIKGTQTISFAVPGPRNVLLGSVSNNVASGGAGSGAITYASGNTNAVAVNPTTGAATAAGLGSATVTATKAADANYNAAQASYVVNVQSAGSVHAWVGEQMSEAFLPATANNRSFARARVADCALVTTDLANCGGVELSPVNGASILDNKATLSTPAYYAVVNGPISGQPVLANVKRFSERILHGAVFFNNRYWIIGGATPLLPGPLPTQHVPQSDVWSSSDGKTWRLETASAAFGTRWLHKTLVYENAIWLLGGVRADNTGSNEVWRSTDGVNWTLINPAAPLFALGPPLPPVVTVPALSATVFQDKIWIVRGGSSLSTEDGINWTEQSARGAIDGVVSREYASLTVYNNKLWYIGGSKVLAVGNRVAQNDIWTSDDGIIWTQLTPNAFAARHQHAAFVLNNRLWIFGGQRFNGTTAGPPPNDAWSTTNGTSWTQEALETEIDRSWLMGTVQEAGKVTLIGGVLRAYSNHVWQTTDGDNWTELAPFDYAPRLLSRGVAFKGAMWVIGGGRLDGLDTNDVWRSADGLTWSRVNTSGPIFSPRDSQRVLVFNDRLWVIAGWDFFTNEGGSETFYNDVWSSADGETWTQHAPTGPIFSPRAGHEAAVFNGRMWVVGGSDGNTRYNDVWSSADGVNWVLEQASAAFSPRYTHSLVALDGALWLFAGSATPSGTTPATGLQDAWRSTDGRNWTQLPPPPFAARMETAAAVLNGRIYLTAGVSNDGYFTNTRYNDVWSIGSDRIWRQETLAAPFSGRNSPVLISHNDELYVIGGFSISRAHDVWRSDDGIHWSTAFSHPISSP